MHIGNDPQRSVDRSKDRKLDKRGKAADSLSSAKSLLFGEQLVGAVKDAANNSLDTLLEGIDLAGKAFVDAPNEESFNRYRDLVRAFMRQAQGQAYQVSREFDAQNRLHSIVREVDKQMVEIQDQIMLSQRRPLEVAARVREVRGLLMDLYI